MIIHPIELVILLAFVSAPPLLACLCIQIWYLRRQDLRGGKFIRKILFAFSITTLANFLTLVLTFPVELGSFSRWLGMLDSSIAGITLYLMPLAWILAALFGLIITWGMTRGPRSTT